MGNVGRRSIRGPWSRWARRAVLLVTAMAASVLLLGRATTIGAPGHGAGRGTGQTQPLQGNPAPEIRAFAFDSRSVQLSALRGRVVLVNFFASWCAECRSEIPDIERAYRVKRASGFEVVGVNAWENGDGLAFLRELGGTYPAVADPGPAPNQPGPIARAYGLDNQALPVSVFIDRAGRVHQVYPGRIDGSNIAAELGQMGIR